MNSKQRNYNLCIVACLLCIWCTPKPAAGIKPRGRLLTPSHILHLPFLNGYTIKDFELTGNLGPGGNYKLYFLLQKPGHFSADAKRAAALLPKGNWLDKPNLQWFTGTFGKWRISLIFSNGRKQADTIEKVRTNYPYTGYSLLLMSITDQK